MLCSGTAKWNKNETYVVSSGEPSPRNVIFAIYFPEAYSVICTGSIHLNVMNYWIRIHPLICKKCNLT